MKSFKQYISESITSYADHIKSVLTSAALEHGFDPRDLQKHRARGTHHGLLRAGGPFDTHINHVEDIDDMGNMTTHYTFDVPGLNKKIHDPKVNLRIATHDHSGIRMSDHRPQLEHEVDFKFGEMFGHHPSLSPLERSDVMSKVFSGVMRGIAHFTIQNDVDPRRERFTFFPFAGALGDQPLKTATGKERKITPKEQKERVYNHMMKALTDLHTQLRT